MKKKWYLYGFLFLLAAGGAIFFLNNQDEREQAVATQSAEELATNEVQKGQESGDDIKQNEDNAAVQHNDKETEDQTSEQEIEMNLDQWLEQAQNGVLDGVDVQLASQMDDVKQTYGEPLRTENYMEGDYYHYQDFTVIANHAEKVHSIKVTDTLFPFALEDIVNELGEGSIWVEHDDYTAYSYSIGEYRLLVYFHPASKAVQTIWLIDDQLVDTAS